MIKMIKEFFKKRTLKKAFSKYISPEKIDKIFKEGDNVDIDKLTASYLEIFIVMVNGDSPQSISKKMGRVADIGSECYGIVDTLISSIVVIFYGTDLFDGSNKHAPNDLIEKIKAEFQKEVKIVIVKGSGYYGNIGGPNRFSYSFILSEFPKALSVIHSLSFGDVKYINTTEQGAPADACTSRC